MDHTEFIKPNDPMSTSALGATRILIGKMSPKCLFRPREWKRIASGVTIMLRKPSVLCVCNMYEHPRSPFMTGIFHVVDSMHGTGNLTLKLFNLKKCPLKPPTIKSTNPPFCAFAIKLDDVQTAPVQLRRVSARKREDKKPAPATVTTTSQRNSQPILRVSANRLRWRSLRPEDEANETGTTKTTTLSAMLSGMDIRQVGGFDVKAISDPTVSVSGTETLKGSNEVIVRLSHRTNGNRKRPPPESITLVLIVMTRRTNVMLRHGTDGVLQKLSPNGFRFHLPRAVRLEQGHQTSVSTGTKYSSETYTALYLPYDVDGVNQSVVIWLPGTTLTVTLTAFDRVSLTPGTALGEIRFISNDVIQMIKTKQPVTSTSQTVVSARGPDELKPMFHGPWSGHNVRGELPARGNATNLPRPQRDSEDENEEAESEEDESEEDEEEDEEEEDGEEVDGEGAANDDDPNDDDTMDFSGGRGGQGEDDEDETDDDAMFEGEYGLPDDDEEDGNGEEDDDDEESDTDDEDRPLTEREQNSDREAQLYRSYMALNSRARIPPPANMEAWNTAQTIKAMDRAFALEEDDGGYNKSLMLRFDPLGVRLLPEALVPFTFMIPRQAFEPTANSFQFTFLSQPTQVVIFNNLKGEEVGSSRPERQEVLSRKAPRV